MLRFNKIIIILILLKIEIKFKKYFAKILSGCTKENACHHNITRRKQHGNVSM